MSYPDRAKPSSTASLPSFLRGASDRKEDAKEPPSKVGSQPTGQQLRSGQDTASLPPPSPLLVHRYENWRGKRVLISFDSAANVIRLENCFRRRWAFKLVPEESFYCSISDVTSYFTDHDQEHDRDWITLNTRKGTARVFFQDEDDSDCSTFSNFYNALHHLLAFKERRFHAGSPWAITLYLLSAIVSFVLGQQLIMGRASVTLPSSLSIPLVVVSVVATYLFVDFLDRR